MNLLFGFSGRIGRLQWWLAQLANAGVLVAGAIIVVMSAGPGELLHRTERASALVVIVLTIALATWINIASTVKRYHDRDKSGFWFFIVVVPYIGSLWQLVECGFLAGSQRVNIYGPPPGSGSYGDLEELYATFAEPSKRVATPIQSVAVAPQQRTSVPARRSVPAGFGRRGPN